MIKSTDFEKSSITKKTEASAQLNSTVAAIIANIINRGDEALREYTEKYDGCTMESFELSQLAMDKALNSVDPEFLKVMERAAKNIEDFHRKQIQKGFDLPPKSGVLLGQKVTPLERVGIYIPGGSASYPSSVLMNCIPAKIAGVKEIIIATPPSGKKSAKSSHGSGDTTTDTNTADIVSGIDAKVLAAARLSGADRVFAMGGAQAIAALAYGTETVPRVDKITGPGNAYVAEAKRQVFGIVGIDMIAGPSDILIIASSEADPALVAADMLSQCEHGPDSPAVLITKSKTFADKVSAEIELQLKTLPRKEIARKAIDEHSMIIITKSIDEAFEISNRLAPEHLEIFLDEPFNYLDKVKNAGSVFMGKFSPEALGDYYAGPNHTLPTSGTARFSSPLSVDDFVKKTSYTYYTKEALCTASNDVIRFAEEEGLRAHALSISKRVDKL